MTKEMAKPKSQNQANPDRKGPEYHHPPNGVLTPQPKPFFRGKTSALLHRADFVSRYPARTSENRAEQNPQSFAKSDIANLAKPSGQQATPYPHEATGLRPAKAQAKQNYCWFQRRFSIVQIV